MDRWPERFVHGKKDETWQNLFVLDQTRLSRGNHHRQIESPHALSIGGITVSVQCVRALPWGARHALEGADPVSDGAPFAPSQIHERRHCFYLSCHKPLQCSRSSLLPTQECLASGHAQHQHLWPSPRDEHSQGPPGAVVSLRPSTYPALRPSPQTHNCVGTLRPLHRGL